MAKTSDVAGALRELGEAFMRGQMTWFVRYAKLAGLSMSQAGVLFRLHGKGLTKGVSDIGDHLGVSSAAASQLLDRLVQQNLIQRIEDPIDRRAKRISLTERGREVIDGGLQGREQWFTTLADAMSEHERGTVLAGLKILIRKIEESAPSDDAFDNSVAKEEKSRV